MRDDPWDPGTQFWDAWVERTWDREPLVLPSPLGRPVLTAAEAFEIALSMAGEEDSPIRFYRGDALEDAVLPRREDGGFSGYASRAGPGPFLLVLNHAHASDFTLWSRMRSFLAGLFARVGLPALDVQAVILAGAYGLTPFGVHKDHAAVFHWVIEGRKRMHFWSRSPREGLGRSFGSTVYGHDPQLFRARSGRPDLTIEAGPGDLMYWPPRFWHVGEGDGQMSLAVTFTLLGHAQPSQMVAKQVAASYLDYYPAGDALPGAISDALRDARRALRRRETLEVDWIQRLTAGGCSRIPAALPLSELRAGARMTSDARFPIRSRKDRKLTCAANGHLVRGPSRPDAVALLGRVNRGGEHVVPRDSALRKMIQALASCRAIEVLP